MRIRGVNAFTDPVLGFDRQEFSNNSGYLHMKNSLFAVAAVAALSAVAAMPAAAQNVTVFGAIDTNMTHISTKGAAASTTIGSSGNTWSRLGFRGEEDLGGGLKAGFHMELGFDENGANTDTSRLFGRRSTLSLTSKDLGELRLGRDLTPTYTAITAFDPFGGMGVASAAAYHATTHAAANNSRVRADNGISYLSPKFGPVSFQLTHALDENAVNAGNKYNGGKLVYSEGAVAAQLAHAAVDAAVGKAKQTSLGVSYDFGFVKTSGLYTKNTYALENTKSMLLGASIPVSASGLVRASFINQDSTTAAKDGKQYALGYVHNLSKRTALYGTVSLKRNDTAADSKQYQMGMSHTF